MQFNLSIEQLRHIFNCGEKQGRDNATSYDWGQINKFPDIEAFKESLIECMFHEIENYVEREEKREELRKMLDDTQED